MTVRTLLVSMMTLMTISILKSAGSSVTSEEEQSVTEYLNRFGYPENKNLSQAIRSDSTGSVSYFTQVSFIPVRKNVLKPQQRMDKL